MLVCDLQLVLVTYIDGGMDVGSLGKDPWPSLTQLR